MYSAEYRWRAVTLHYAYGVPCEMVGRILGVSGRAVRRWYDQFKSTGHVLPGSRAPRPTFSSDVVEFVSVYVRGHPCFYVEELLVELKRQFPDQRKGLSTTSILRLLRFQLGLSRKVLERRAREAVPIEVATYMAKLRCFYTYPEQLLFLDETSKNGLDSMRGYAWSKRGTKAIARVPFKRGARVSIMAACDVRGFVAWVTTRGTFTRKAFHRAFVNQVVRHLNPWPLPRSIVILDNAVIHMYAELEQVVQACGAILLYLPPYCPQLNPIEVMFGRLKQWLIRHANLTFSLYPELVLNVAMKECLKGDDGGVNLFSHCGYGRGGLNECAFELEE